MSQANVELSCRAVDAFNRHDLDGYVALMHDDVEVVPRILGGLGSRIHGHSGIRRWWKDLSEFIPDLTVEPVETRDLGELTIVRVQYRGHGATSDSPFAEVAWLLLRWQHGKCVSWSSHATDAEALEAAGVRE
jgi:ketosteroid isomerase-like protein